MVDAVDSKSTLSNGVLVRVQSSVNFMDLFQHDLFLFDFDGLLVNTEPLHYEAYKKSLEGYGTSLNWDFAKYCLFAHRGTKEFSAAIYADFPGLQEIEPNWQAVRKKKTEHYLELICKGPIELMPGVLELVQELQKRNIPHCIVTNSTQDEVTAAAQHQPLIRKIPWVTRETYRDPKPAPDAYLEGLARFGKEAKNPVGFEDTLKGILSLQAAQVKPVLICSEQHPQLGDPLLEGVAHYQRIYPLNALCHE